MSWPDRKQTVFFLLHVAVLMTLLMLPWPGLADKYRFTFEAAGNAVICPIFNALSLSGETLHFDEPEVGYPNNRWNAPLRLESNTSGRATHINVDSRTFSYRPVATFFALALAAPLAHRRRWWVIGGGTLLMFGFGLLFTALLILAIFTAGGSFGQGTGLAVRTLYEAIATPAMVYFAPILAFWSLVLTRLNED